MTVGLVSDTHGYFDPQLSELFSGVDHILHAGDIGGQPIIDDLLALAPVTAVLGNNDFDPAYRQTEVVELLGYRIMIHHIVDRLRPTSALREQILRFQAQIVVFGHTHTRYLDRDGHILWINPGYAGRPRFNQARSVALLHLPPAGPKVEFLPLN